MTGTSVNPLLRAAHLTVDRDEGAVTLMVPWVELEDQRRLFPNNITFASQEEQRRYVLKWVSEKANMPAAARKLRLEFYHGRYLASYGSIFSTGPYVGSLPEGDLCILEEPEHLTWFRYAEVGWMDKFKRVVGVMHTNYAVYARQERGLWAVGPVKLLNKISCRAHCHRVVKLSATLQTYARHKECVSNVHGVREAFLEAGHAAMVEGFPGDKTTRESSSPAPAKRMTSSGKGGDGGSAVRVADCYFISKQLWAKGYRLLFGLMEHYRKTMGGAGFAMDLYGSGPDSDAIERKARRSKLDISMKGYADHALLGRYKVFINPSITEVLCTTVAEALAMGKWVVVPKHPSNAFFAPFPNCLQYESKQEFAECVHWALTNEPPTLLPEVRHALSWDAAMQRLQNAAQPAATTTAASSSSSSTQGGGACERTRLDRFAHHFYNWLGSGFKGDLIRAVSGGGCVAWQSQFKPAPATTTTTTTSV